MAMDPQTELNLLETAYQNYLTGGVASYTISTDQGSRTVTLPNFQWLVQRVDELRALIYRQNNGMFQAAQNRTPE